METFSNSGFAPNCMVILDAVSKEFPFVSESLAGRQGARRKPDSLMPPTQLSKIGKRPCAYSLKRRLGRGSCAVILPTDRFRLAPAAGAAYDLYFDQDDCRAPTTGFIDDCCNVGCISGRGRGGHLLRAVRPLRQRRVSQY